MFRGYPGLRQYDRNRCGIRYGVLNAAEDRLQQRKDYIDSICDWEGVYGHCWDEQKIKWCKSEYKKIGEERNRLLLSRAYIYADCGDEEEEDWVI